MLFRSIYRGEDNSYYEKILATGEVKCIDEEVPFEVPQGWEWTKLNDIYNFIDYRGATPKKLSNGIPLITAKNVKFGYLDYTVKDFISSEEFEQRQSRGISQKGDLLFTTEAPLGNVAIADKYEFSAGQRLITLQAYSNECTCNKTFMYFMLSPIFQELLQNSKTGTTVAGIKASKLKEIVIPIPPYAEQLRIIDRINQLQGYLKKYSDAQNALDTLNETINIRLKKSILQEAIQGRLVPQITEEGTATELLEQIKTEKLQLVKEGKFKKSALADSVIYKGDDNKYYTINKKERISVDDEIPFDIPNTWEWCRLGTLFSHCTGKALNVSNQKGELMTYITTSNLYWDRFELDNLKQMRFTDEEIEKCTATFGDLLVCEGGDIGRAAIWNYQYDIRIQNHIHKLRAYKQLCTKFFFWVFYFYKATGRIGGKGIGIQGLSSKALDNILIPLPPLKEQQRIVAQIEKLFEQLR